MEPIKQEHLLGCAVACVGFVAGITYQDALKLFDEGAVKVSRGFYCYEIVRALQKIGLQYQTKYVVKNKSPMEIADNYIVYIKKSPAYQGGHYLVRTKDTWMDPWISYPELSVKAGFRKELPGEPQYAVVPQIKLRY